MAMITNMQHYLDDHGTLTQEMPGPAYNLALFLGAVTAWVTSHPDGQHVLTNVPCRRSPGRRRCSGTIHAALAPDGATIVWECPVCHDQGLIHGWEATPWDRRSPAVSERK